MKKTLPIAFGVAIGLSLHSLAQLAVSAKCYVLPSLSLSGLKHPKIFQVL